MTNEKNLIYSICIFILGFVALIFSLTQVPYIQKNTPVGRYQKAYQFYRLAKKFSPASQQYHEYMAIARALLKNQKSFSYETSQMPLPQGVPPNINQ